MCVRARLCVRARTCMCAFAFKIRLPLVPLLRGAACQNCLKWSQRAVINEFSASHYVGGKKGDRMKRQGRREGGSGGEEVRAISRPVAEGKDEDDVL